MRRSLLIVGAIVAALFIAATIVVVVSQRAVSHAVGSGTFSAAAHLSDQVNKLQGGRARPWADYKPPKITLPNPNAFDVYLKAIALKDRVDHQVHPGRPVSSDIEPSDLPAYDGVLKLTRQAFTMDCRLPWPGGIEDIQPYIAGMRHLAMLFETQASVLATKGQFAAAASSLLDALKVARDLGTQRYGYAALSGMAIELSTLTRHLPDVLPKLSEAECEAAEARLLKLEASRVPVRELIDGQEAVDKVWFNEVMHDPSKLQYAIEMWPGTDPPGYEPPRDFRKSWDELGAYFDQLRAAAAKPFAQRGAFTLPQDVPAHYLAYDWTRVLLRAAEGRTGYHLAELQLAGRRYLLKTGHLPARLDDLTPKYISSIPADPFGTGPMHSTTRDGVLVIYSVGPDGVDDGGKPVAAPNRLAPTSRGDLTVTISAH